MTVQQKINALNKRLYKVSFNLSSRKVAVQNLGACVSRPLIYNSINQAYNAIVKHV